MWLGLLLLATSYLPLLLPRRLFASPTRFFHGYPVVPGHVLAFASILFMLAVIVLSEAVCRRLGAPSLWQLATRGGRVAGRVALAAGAAGLAMEVFAQWLARLWVYPYWTPWLYWLVVLPGFVLYWTSIVESYLAAKAVLDALATPHGNPHRRYRVPRLYRPLGVLGGGLLLTAAGLYARWYATHGGYRFSVTEPVRDAPPFGYILLAFSGAWLVAEWQLHRRGSPSFASSVLRGYWAPAAAVVTSSLLVAVVMESQNAVNQFWAYAHLPAPRVTLIGVPLSVFAAWPMQYLVFLLLPSPLVPGLAALFWNPPPCERPRATVRPRPRSAYRSPT